MDEWVEEVAKYGHRYQFKIKNYPQGPRQPKCSCRQWRGRFYRNFKIREAYEAWKEHAIRAAALDKLAELSQDLPLT